MSLLRSEIHICPLGARNRWTFLKAGKIMRCGWKKNWKDTAEKRGYSCAARRYFLGDEFLEELLPDPLQFPAQPAGKKWILKGNHDYWWQPGIK